MFTFNSTIEKNIQKKITFRLLPCFGKILLKSSLCDRIHPQQQFVLRLSSKVEHRTCKCSTPCRQNLFRVPATTAGGLTFYQFHHHKSFNTFRALYHTVGLRPTIQQIQNNIFINCNCNYFKFPNRIFKCETAGLTQTRLVSLASTLKWLQLLLNQDYLRLTFFSGNNSLS